ncbi:MAG: glycosyltransferase family 39 protein, partial [Proteobacteria bacterium]|nr:glycosyltransferase family 39 protein [Pseudomonadota bacterium]
MSLIRQLLSKDKKWEDKRFVVIVVVIGMLALGIRLYWALVIQPPDETIFSDMRSYMWRAVYLLLGDQESSPERKLDMVLFPYGVHYLYAFQMWFFGEVTPELREIARYHFVGHRLPEMSIVQAVISAGAVVFIMLAARRCFHTLVGPVIVGVTAAVWHPQIAYVGFFSSETPFSLFVPLSLWLWIRYAQTGKGSASAGIATAVGATLRPQMLLYHLLALCWVAVRHKRLVNFRWRHVIWLLLPAIMVVGFSSYRFYHFTGRFGLVSDNAAIGRFFASTNYINIKTEEGRRFTPPARSKKTGFEGSYRFDSYIADAEPLDAERRRIQSQLTLGQKLALVQRNIAMLFHRNVLWPECNAVAYSGSYAQWKERKALRDTRIPSKQKRELVAQAKKLARNEAKITKGWRHRFAERWKPFVPYLLVPLALFGICLLAFRYHAGLELAALHVATTIYTAAMYFGELRYRVPYDMVF